MAVLAVLGSEPAVEGPSIKSADLGDHVCGCVCPLVCLLGSVVLSLIIQVREGVKTGES